MGDPGGVGGEITIQAWRQLRESGPDFFLIDDPERLRTLGEKIIEIAEPNETQKTFATALPVLPLKTSVRAMSGLSSPENAPAVIESIERAVGLALNGKAAGVVTNPIQKSS